MSNGKANKYKVLLLGYLLLFGAYFGFRAFQFATMQRASGEINKILWGHFRIGNPRRSGDTKGEYPCPEVHFLYKTLAQDTATWFIISPESYAFHEYKPGEQANVIFPKDQPNLATLYSLGDFWFTPPYIIILLVISVAWTIGYVVVVFKPWRGMGEGDYS